MQLSFSGGAMEIGGSCIYLRADGKGILLDSGIRQGNARDPIPDFRIIQQMGGVDAILVSHAHMDHTGTLPIISKAYPQSRIYMTAMTADLVRVLLSDSLKIMDRREGEIPHYAQQDVTAMLNRIHPLNFRVRFPIFDEMYVTLYPAGHIAGAACIYLETREGTLFYSGDFCSFPQKTIEGIHIPKLRPDVAIVETTYGDRLHANRQVEEGNLISLVGQCVRRGDKVLIPAFALGRSQEVILLLKAAIQNGQIPSVPVYVDGMVRDINSMYQRNPTYLKSALARTILKGNPPFYTKEITPVPPTQNRDELLAKEGPAVFVSSSGMLNGGPSVQYAKKIASMENGCIIITGYQDEESPGRKLTELLERSCRKETGIGCLTQAEAGRQDMAGGNLPQTAAACARDASSPCQEPALVLDGTTIPVRCRIHRAGLSAHGDKDEIHGLLDRLSPRDLFLVHGDRNVIEEFGNELGQDYRRRVYLPECGTTYELNYRNKRKQLHQTLPWSMERGDALEDGNEGLLWDYVREHYPDKDLTCEQLFFIWSGKNVSARTISHEQFQEPLENLQKRLLKSVYFSPNPRRLFLFCANSEEQVRELLTPKEMTVQQIEEVVQDLFFGFPYKKISFHRESRKVLLNFDFPDAVDSSAFETHTGAFYEKSGWQISIAPSMNHAAASMLLSQLFEGRIKKTSYFTEQKAYELQLASQEEADIEKCTRFQKATGWLLRLCGTGSPNARPLFSSASNNRHHGAMDAMMFLPVPGNAAPMEQNMVQYCIDQAFEGQKHRVYKKSIKSDAQGNYMELAFLSPEVGKQYGELLAQLACQTQWRIRIADSVNQKEVFEIVQMLCNKYEIPLRKNPSYMPQSRTIQIRTDIQPSQEACRNLMQEAEETTGLPCMVSG